jgi:arylsulfatase A-like enzyme
MDTSMAKGLCSSALALVLVAVGWPTLVRGQSETRPLRIVLILADDLGPGDLGCYGGKIADTPNLDRLARTGTRFTQYYAAAPICSPSRCGLLTGCWPGRWRLTSFLQERAGNRGCDQVDFLDPAAPSLPRLLRAAGYRTAHIGKWHLGGGRDVVNAPGFAAYGYDEHVGTYESPEPHPDITASNWIWSDKDKVKRWQRTGYFVERTLDFLRRNQDRPCFVNLWLDDPHTPWVPAAQWKKGETLANLRPVMTELDRQVGLLLAGLKEQGIEKDTLVLFLSDNGPLPTFNRARTVGLRGSKLSLYEGGVRLPCLASWPGHVTAGSTDDTTILAAVDFVPTLAALAGARLPKGISLDGEDRSLALRGTPLRERQRPLFWEYGRNEKFFRYPPGDDRSPNLALRDGVWKFLINADGSNPELYDLSTDPREASNLIAVRPEVAMRLKDRLLAWRKSLP